MKQEPRPFEIFVVVKQGVYIQDVYGPFYTERSARIFAQDAAMHDDDSYHGWDVYLLTEDGLISSKGLVGLPFASYQKLDERFLRNMWYEHSRNRLPQTGIY